jgi:hypothetical protein
MKSHRAKIGAFFALVLMLSPISAKERQQSPKQVKNAEIELAKYAQCVVKSSAKQVDTYLGLSPDSPDYSRAQRSMNEGVCLSYDVGKLKVPDQMMRWALFEALYDRRFGRVAPPNLTGVALLNFASEREKMSASLKEQHFFMRDFGDCVARKDSVSVHKLLSERVYSAAEKADFDALQLTLGQCLIGKGKVRFTRTGIRGMLAEAMYKLRSEGGSTS